MKAPALKLIAVVFGTVFLAVLGAVLRTVLRVVLLGISLAVLRRSVLGAVLRIILRTILRTVFLGVGIILGIRHVLGPPDINCSCLLSILQTRRFYSLSVRKILTFKMLLIIMDHGKGFVRRFFFRFNPLLIIYTPFKEKTIIPLWFSLSFYGEILQAFLSGRICLSHKMQRQKGYL